MRRNHQRSVLAFASFEQAINIVFFVNADFLKAEFLKLTGDICGSGSFVKSGRGNLLDGSALFKCPSGKLSKFILIY